MGTTARLTDPHIRESLARIDQRNADAARKRQAFERGHRQFWRSAVAAAAGSMGGAGVPGAFLNRAVDGGG